MPSKTGKPSKTVKVVFVVLIALAIIFVAPVLFLSLKGTLNAKDYGIGVGVTAAVVLVVCIIGYFLWKYGD
jgi:heme/copper-type cytochrome/quinol oxidase subunit 4